MCAFGDVSLVDVSQLKSGTRADVARTARTMVFTGPGRRADHLGLQIVGSPARKPRTSIIGQSPVQMFAVSQA